MIEYRKKLSDITNYIKNNSDSPNTELNELLFDFYRSYSDDADCVCETEEEIRKIIPSVSVYYQIYLYSFLMRFSKNADVFNDLVVLATNELDIPLIMQFVYQQCSSFYFLNPSVNNYETDRLLWRLHQKTVSLIKDNFRESLEPIPICERDPNFVIVICDQFLSSAHGPTKTSSDRCKILIENCRKKVFLINTGEVLNCVGEIPFFSPLKGNYIDHLEKAETISWKECKIPFFQCPKGMPDFGIYGYLLETIRKMRPYYIVAIGADGFFSQLANELVPVLTVGLCPSKLAMTETTCQTLSKKLTKEDIALLESVGYDQSHVIKSAFSYSLVEKDGSLLRENLNIYSDSFVISIVGGRLGSEMDSDFMQMLADIAAKHTNVEYMILGSLGSNMSLEDLPYYEKISEKTHFFYMVKDILSYLELSDLYINPTRRGGGGSAVEALTVNVPVITTDYGDVAVNVGDDFIVKDYEEMKERIDKMISDTDYRKEQSLRAKSRAQYLLDSDRHFMETLEEFEGIIIQETIA